LCNCCGSVGLPSKRLGLQFVLIYFVATSHITSNTIPNCFFLLIHSIVHAIVDDTFSFLRHLSQNTWGLRSLQNTEIEANLLLPLGIQKQKGFQLQWDFAPLTRGSVPGLRWGLRPQTPVIGSRSPCVSTPHFLTWRRPCEARFGKIALNWIRRPTDVARLSNPVTSILHCYEALHRQNTINRVWSGRPSFYSAA